MWAAFGVVSPDAYMIPQQVGEEEELIDEPAIAGPIYAIQILEDSTEEGNPDYKPDVAIVTQGHTIEWTNEDSVAHTVTSAIDFGETFDSNLMNAGDVFTLDTTNL